MLTTPRRPLLRPRAQERAEDERERKRHLRLLPERDRARAQGGGKRDEEQKDDTRLDGQEGEPPDEAAAPARTAPET
jgi:hypothetical protein